MTSRAAMSVEAVLGATEPNGQGEATTRRMRSKRGIQLRVFGDGPFMIADKEALERPAACPDARFHLRLCV